MPVCLKSWFQSTPANFTAGDPSSAPAAWSTASFNPRPPISQRATVGDGNPRRRGPVSIHARQFHSGRRYPSQDWCQMVRVSIHARQFHSGRPALVWRLSAHGVRFNPRPPISQRATSGVDGRCSCAGVSIHARQFHSGRLLRPLVGSKVKDVSIHARQFHSGRPLPIAPVVCPL